MKKNYRVTLAVVVLALLSSHASAVDADDNAAAYYLNAVSSIKYPKSKKINKKLTHIIENGWEKERPGLVRLLDKNQACLNEASKAASFEKCDFDLGKKYEYEVLRTPPPLAQLRKLCFLTLLNGSYLEWCGKMDGAINAYISSLKLARHIAQSKVMAAKIMAIAMEKLSLAPLRRCVNSKEIDKNELGKIANYLTMYKEKHSSVRELIECEKRFFISTAAQMLSDGLKEHAKKNYKNDKETRDRLSEFSFEFMRQGKELAERYYGNYIKAAEDNTEDSWKHALDEMNALKDSVGPFTAENVMDVSRALFNMLTKNTEEYNKQVSRKVLSILLLTSMPDFKKAVDAYYKSNNALKDLQLLVAEKLSA